MKIFENSREKVDVPWYSGGNFETYARKYRQMYASGSYKSVYEQIRQSISLFLKLVLAENGFFTATIHM